MFIAPTTSPTDTASVTGFDENVLRSDVNGTVASLNSPAEFTHPIVDDRWTAEIGDLTRNVQIAGTPGHYSHIFIRSTQPQTLRYVQLSYLGVPNVLGRYALHFHHAGDGSRGSVVAGVVIDHAGGHAFVPHASNGITFTDTIAYNVGDDAYWWDPDTSTSIGNGSSEIIDHAIAAQANNTNIGLAGFRLGEGTELTNSVTNSVAVGIDGGKESSGFSWNSGSTVWKFQNNIAHNNKANGIFVWQNDQRQHEIVDFAAYNNRYGIQHGAYKNAYHYKDITLYANSEAGILLFASSSEGLVRFDNLHIDEAGLPNTTGIDACCHHVAGTNYPTVITNATITGSTDASLQSTDADNGDWIQLQDSDLGVIHPYSFGAAADPTNRIEVITPTSHYVLTPGAH